MQEIGVLVVCVLAILPIVMSSEGPLKFHPKSVNRHFNIFEKFTKYQRHEKENAELYELFKMMLRQSGKAGHKERKLKNFNFHDCGGTVATIKQFSISPDPIVVPGIVTFNAEIDLKSSVMKSPVLNAEVTVEKKAGGVYIKLPCVDQIGSCTYADLCSMLNAVTQCPPFLLENQIKCKCPYKAGVYSVNNGTLQYSEADLPSGDYQIHAVITIKNQKAACVNVQFSIAY